MIILYRKYNFFKNVVGLLVNGNGNKFPVKTRHLRARTVLCLLTYFTKGQ